MSEGKQAAEAEAKKSEGNKAYGSGDYRNAVAFYSEAIALDPSNKVYYSNRCASYTCLQMMDEAIADGQKCIALAPDWHKGFFRLANAQKVREC
jgi:stress-induced-phosphoprotein 1